MHSLTRAASAYPDTVVGSLHVERLFAVSIVVPMISNFCTWIEKQVEKKCRIVS